MQHCRPAEQRFKLRMRQFWLLGLPLLVHLHGGFQHASGLFSVNVVLIGQTFCGTAANILMAEAAFHFIQHAFAQRAVGKAKLADSQSIKNAAQNRQARHKDRFSFFRQTRQAERIKGAVLQHF